MELVGVDPQHPDPTTVARAAALIRAGRLVAFPTETVYGLGANALDATAIARIYTAKGRPNYNPLIVHLASQDNVNDVVRAFDHRAQKLADAFWPGPMTLVLPKRDVVPDSATAGLPTVAVRVPSHAVAHALLVAAGLPIAAPSANRSMQLSPTDGAHVAKSLGDNVDMILDAGPTMVGIESTVIDLTRDVPVLLRPGSISIPQIEAVVGLIIRASDSHGGAARPSPGMLDRHYSPRARLLIANANDVGALMERERMDAKRVGAVVIDADVESTSSVVRLPRDAHGYASRLFATLHALDDAGCDTVVVERVPDAPDWLGVRDRLSRAAT